jgi:hypothetical protein
MSELGFPVTRRAQRNDVSEIMGVERRRNGRLNERPDRDEVMDVRVTPEFSVCRSTADTLVVVAFECRSTDALPTTPVVGVRPARPVRMPFAGERLRKPLVLALVGTEDVFGSQSTRPSFDLGVAFVALNRLFSPVPP